MKLNWLQVDMKPKLGVNIELLTQALEILIKLQNDAEKNTVSNALSSLDRVNYLVRDAVAELQALRLLCHSNQKS